MHTFTTDNINAFLVVDHNTIQETEEEMLLQNPAISE